jgi:hypothetical protein
MDNILTDVETSRPFFESGRRDPELLFSEIYDLGILDPKGSWSVWVARPDAEFDTSPEASAARSFELTGMLILLVLTVLAGAIWAQFRRQRSAAERHAGTLRVTAAA